MPQRPEPSAIVAELYTILEAVTADGRITPEEVQQLQTWLDQNGDAVEDDIRILRAAVQDILADGQVTPEELAVLHRVVEKILPPASRRVARAQRQAVESADNARAKAERAAASQQRREEMQRQRPMLTVNFMVAGVNHEGRDAIVSRYVRVNGDVWLAREPDNPHDPFAVGILIREGYKIGYVPRDDARDLAPVLDAGCWYQAHVTKIYEGRIAPIPIVQIYCYSADANVPDSKHSRGAIPIASSKKVAKSGCGCCLVPLLAMVAVIAAVAVCVSLLFV